MQTIDFELLSSSTAVENFLREEIGWGRAITGVQGGLEKQIVRFKLWTQMGAAPE